MATTTANKKENSPHVGRDYSDWSKGPSSRCRVEVEQNPTPFSVGKDYSGYSHGPARRQSASCEANQANRARKARQPEASFEPPGSWRRETIAVVMTCHNRAALTARCIESILKCTVPQNVSLRLYLTDDGSTDGTSDIARKLFPEAVVSRGDGSLYWCGGMRLSMQKALADGADFVLWLNDDVVLNPTAISDAYDTYKSSGPRSIAIGSTSESPGGAITYGGLRSRTRAIIDPRIEEEYSVVDPRSEQTCDTMAGQFVLIPRLVAQEVGPIEPGFTHWLGDVDYGYRARKKGIRLKLISRISGTCAPNPRQASWKEPEQSLSKQFKKLNSIKGLASGERMLYYRRHGGCTWWLAWAAPYFGQILSHAGKHSKSLSLKS